MLVEDEFDDRELTGPLEALRSAGVTVVVVGPTCGRRHTAASGARPSSPPTSRPARRRSDDFDALVIPGGHAPDKMRMRHAMVDLARDAMEAGKPVAAICHGPQVLISANALRGRTLTCWPSIAIDVKNAGGLYVDKPVVEDGNLITSRKPDDVPVFSEAIIRALVTLAGTLDRALAARSDLAPGDSAPARGRLVGPSPPQPRIRGGELHAVEQNHRLQIDPHQKHHDRGDRAVHAREPRSCRACTTRIPRSASFQSSPVTSAPIHTSRKRTLAFGTK